MSQPGVVKEWRLVARCDLWTGDADRKGERVIPTGLLGSIRWWCEVVVRGLGGAACDPTDQQNRCPDGERRCPVCHLFGCTGRARKFRFEVRDTGGRVLGRKISKGTRFVLRFTPLRPIAPEEWSLLDLTLRLIAGYGAMGGKTVLKPSDDRSRESLPHHRDYGLVEIESDPLVEPLSRGQLTSYVCNQRWRRLRQDGFAWASLSNFWCVNGKYLARQEAARSTFNKVLGRRERKDQAQQLENAGHAVNAWLAGRQQQSKKVFSFKNPPRTFGFVDPDCITLEQMKLRLKGAWAQLQEGEFVTGERVLDDLLRGWGTTR
jgi:CRISPR-associated protein Cmr1